MIKEKIAITIGTMVLHISKALNLGAGATWPGEVALFLEPSILSKLLTRVKKGIIIVAGTNGKTTTSLMIQKILRDKGFTVLHNESGANLLNGIVSAFFTDNVQSYDYAVFEVDENTLPMAISNIIDKRSNRQIKNKKDKDIKLIIVLLNLFRDQLDRYGEVDAIAEKLGRSLRKLGASCRIIVNADDPHLACIGKQLDAKVSYFGLGNKKYYIPKMQHATDTIYCPTCGTRLTFKGVYFSHLGDWVCTSCTFHKPRLDLTSRSVLSPLEGVYNTYNTLAATLTGVVLGIKKYEISTCIRSFRAAFGRMEDVRYKGKTIKILLSKNPTGFNESLRSLLQSKKKGPVLLLLNDRIPDGTDVSWIWDVDFEQLHASHYPIVISGDRYLDMAVRIKYALSKLNIKNKISNIQIKYKKYEMQENLESAVNLFSSSINVGETGWILATYSAMLDVRKIITGRKIL